MKKLIGIALFLGVLYFVLLQAHPNSGSLENHLNVAKRIGFFGILSLGAALLIVTGGIDLSIGAVIGLSTTVGAMMLNGHLPGLVERAADGTRIPHPWPPLAMVPAVLLMGALIGLVNGLLTTKLKLQAFVVTLCGLFIFRGLARWLAGDASQAAPTGDAGFQAMKALLYSDRIAGLPKFFAIFLVLLALATVFLHLTVYGRYFFAIGANEQAARYAGIATGRYKVLAYVLCSTLAAFGGVLLLADNGSAAPTEDGNFYELYAIAGAVLGGFSLRGGEGTTPGIFIGAAILVLLPNLVNMWGVKSELDFTVIGGALLLGAMLDELMRRRVKT